ncbi:MAG TPA: PfkB family carbohydrate kinase, partial [bacterium]|nr:PfkB family carbohydrate kinase [bacterium]
LLVCTAGARGGVYRRRGSGGGDDDVGGDGGGGSRRSGGGSSSGEGSWAAAPPPGPVVDSYGCGDSFAAGLTYGLGAGMPAQDAIDLAARCGAACLTGHGPYEHYRRGS